MKTLLAGVKGKIMVGALAVGLIGGGVAAADGFGFLDQLSTILGGANEKAAVLSAGEVDKSDEQYKTAIKADVDAATKLYADGMAGQAVKEINRGKGEVKAHYDHLKADLNTTVNNSLTVGKALITEKVNTQVTTSKSDIENSAVAAINAQLQLNSTTKYFSGNKTVTR